MEKFYGKYRGKVINNIDPLRLGRLSVIVPTVMPAPLANWAMPCVPYAGVNVGLYAMPPIGANIWVEFEDGDPTHPIWTGCFWGPTELPLEISTPNTIVFKNHFVTLKMDEVSTSFAITVITPVGPMQLSIDPTGISLTNMSASVHISPQVVEVRNGTSNVIVRPDGVSIQPPLSPTTGGDVK